MPKANLPLALALLSRSNAGMRFSKSSVHDIDGEGLPPSSIAEDQTDLVKVLSEPLLSRAIHEICHATHGACTERLCNNSNGHGW